MLAAAAAVLVAAPAQAATPVSVTYTAVGESAFTVPAGVHAVEVSLTGARGGSMGISPGGRGAAVTGLLPVTPGDRLYAEVGGPGIGFTIGGSWAANAGGANGGGAGSSGGGGASDIRRLPAAAPGSLESRLAVAGGGGGAGFKATSLPVGGGDAGARGIDPSGGPAGGHPGTQAAGGAGGTATAGGADGGAGSLGVGGQGQAANFRGGGGGGGYYGGGGGAGMGACKPCDRNGGGGGGSSLVPAGGTAALAALTDPAQVTISYDPPEARVSATRIEFPSTQPGAISAGRAIEVTNATRTTEVLTSPAMLASDDFVLAGSSCGVLAPGETCRISVRYAPSAHGRHDATLRLDTNGGRFTIALAGESAAPPPAPADPAPPAPADPAPPAPADPAPADPAPPAPARPADPAPPALAPAASGPASTPHRAPETRVRLRCAAKRCTVAFGARAPKVAAGGTRVTATLARGSRVYATARATAPRGRLRLVLKPRRAIKPGAYSLKLRIGAARTTWTAVAA
jgi:hypothetical protein